MLEVKNLFKKKSQPSDSVSVPTFSCSPSMKDEYKCSVVQVGKISPIPERDLIGETIVNNFHVVVRKDMVHEGDVMLYVHKECVIHPDFLRKNNLYCKPELNDNPEHKGFFEEQGRVRVTKLGGVLSEGYLFPISELINSGLVTVEDASTLNVGDEFDTVNGVVFVKAFVPKMKVKPTNRQRVEYAKPTYVRMPINEWNFHYDTQSLEDHVNEISPDNYITVSVKEHGISLICKNAEVSAYLTWFDKLKKLLGFKVVEKYYDYIYSSRKQIRNNIIEIDKTEYFDDDKFGRAARKFKEYNLLEPDMTVYAEIVGYQNDNSMCQSKYDYGCKKGQFQIMVYRIVTKNGEFNVDDVRSWTELAIKQHPEIAEWLKPITVMYWGKAQNLYDIPVDENWGASFVEHMRHDSNFGMDDDEPMCSTGVPREGVVIRIDNDKYKRAFKLKTDRYKLRDTKNADAGVVDEEMLEAYADEQ